jgi:hypothetical protein
MVMARDQNAGRSQSMKIDNTGEQKKNFFLVPWFLGLFLGLFGALIQKNALDRPHQL